MTSETRTIGIGLIQMRCGEDPAANLERAAAGVRDAARRGADIVCLPELFRSQYFCQAERHEAFALAEPIPGPTTAALEALARELGIVVIAPLFERRAAGLYHNTAAVIDADGRTLGRYRKMHIPDDPLYYEKFYFTPGDLGFRAWRTAKGAVGVCICWDQWFPEAARLTALAGAEVLFFPTAIGWHPAEKAACGAAQREAWRTIQRAHAIANGCYVAAVNRVGHECPAGGDGLEFWGGSFVCGPGGELLAAAAEPAAEEVLVVTVDLARVERQRQQWPFLRDRRTDAYGPLVERWHD